MRYSVPAALLLLAATTGARAQDQAALATEAFAAAAEGDTARLAALVGGGYDVNRRRGMQTALSTAVSFKRIDAVRFLLDHGADPRAEVALPDVAGLDRPMPLIDFARRTSSPEIVALLAIRLPATAATARPIVPPTPAPSLGLPAARWAEPAAFRPGDRILISTNGGLDWRPGTVERVGSGETARQYLVADGAGQRHYLDWTRVTTPGRQPYWTSFFLGDWSLNTGMAAVTRTDGRDLYLVVAGGMRLPPLRVAADGSYVWVRGGKPIRGRWTARADGPGIVLLLGDRGLDWTLYNSTSRTSRDASGADEVRTANPAAAGSVGSRLGS